jgi:hypothetical protein
VRYRPRIVQAGAAFHLAKRKAAGLAVAAAFVVLLAIGSGSVQAAGPVVPDSSCSTESQFKSLTGTTRAVLQITNNTDETVKSYWLDYTGKRVFYENIAPHTSYLQATWLTHPWVITSASGACYRFVVMNSQEQFVSVDPTLGPGETFAPLATAGSTDIAPAPTVTAPTVTAATATAAAATAASTTGADAQPTAAAASGSGNAGSAQGAGPGVTIAIAGVAAAVVALRAWLVINGKMPGLPKGPRS